MLHCVIRFVGSKANTPHHETTALKRRQWGLLKFVALAAVSVVSAQGRLLSVLWCDTHEASGPSYVSILFLRVAMQRLLALEIDLAIAIVGSGWSQRKASGVLCCKDIFTVALGLSAFSGNFSYKQKLHKRFLCMQAVFCFIPHHRLRAVNDVCLHLFTAVGWQAMHK
jgi:hypothetical protein